MIGKIKQRSEVSGKITASGGTNDHNRLTNRDLADQHPIAAITDLQELLDSKLDSETALPLIEDAVKNKAKGLFFDVNKELAKKSYWYLTSEIDPITKMGTKESVISGPYDLGAGGGGGGSGVTEMKVSVAVDPSTGKSMWPTYVAVGGKCIVGINWSSTRDGAATGRGTIYAYVAGKLVETRAVNQGLVTFDLTEYIVSGENKVEIRVVDNYSNTKNIIDIISGVALKLSSNFEDDLSYSGDITFTYIPTGNITKNVYFIIDGVQYGNPEVVESSGEQWTKILPKSLLRHGSHTLEVYFTCTLDGEEVRSNTLYYDLICYEHGNRTPIIASPFIDTVEQEQYVSFVVRYRVFTPGRNTSEVYLYTDSESSAPLTINQKYQSWECRFDVVGNHTLSIRTGTVSKVFNIYVKESTIHVEPVTQAVALALSSYGRSNAEPIEQRAAWNYGDIKGELTGFNWSSNGWVLDNDGITVLRLSGDARAVINYLPFESDFTASGKTFEFEIATSDIKNYETKIFECLDGADTITFSKAFAGEDTRTKKFDIDSVDSAKFIEKVLETKGTYAFIYDGANWNLDGTIISKEELEADYGIKLVEVDLDPSIEEIGHYWAGDRITIYYTVSGHGFYITPQLAKLQSQQASLSTQYKEGDKVRLSFVVEKRTEGTSTFKTKLIYMYINGILSGVSRYPDGDSFQQTPVVPITIGSNDATVDVYNIRIYNNNLTRKQIVNNWIADTRDPVLKAQRFKHNDNYNDENKISLDKIAALGDLPYMILKGESLPAFKKDRKYLEVEFVNPADPSRDFTAVDARADVQGTSSQYYYKKNFKIKFEGGFEDKNGNWFEHYKLRGDDSKKEKTFTFKADVASSEGANNVELVRYFEDTKNWYSPAELEPDSDIPGSTDSKKRIRVGIDGFPIVMFHDNGTSTSFYGKMNFNNDKDNKRTFGFDEGDECWEFLHNTSDLVLFKSDDLSAWQDSFEARYPEEYGDDEHPYGTAPGELDKLQNVLSWVVATRRLATDSDAEKVRKLNKFKTEFTQYFDKNSSLFYYLYTELFLMVDSRAKNAMLAYLKSRQPGDGGNKWFWLPYDMDTALGINNEGLLVYNYDREDTDLQEGAFIFNGQDSTFWMNVRDAFPEELRKMYEDMRTANGADVVGWSYDKAEKYFDDHQAVWSETIFNEDAYTKYLEPYVNNQDATYLGMTQGSKAEQRKWWLSNRFKYLDSKYLTGDAKDTNIMLRAYQRSSFKVKPYLNCYLTGVFDQATAGNTVTQKASKGIVTEIVPPSTWNPQGVDSVVILYSADLIQDIGDISGFKPGYADFSAATKLQRLIIGNADPTYENGNLRGLNIGANHLLTYLDARNCRNLGDGSGTEVTPTIDLSQCYSIEEVYFDNTQIKGVNFPVGGNLKIAHLPETLTSLTIRNHPNLNEFVLAGTQNLTSLWLENIPASAINAYDYIMNMPEQSRVRLIGFEDDYSGVGSTDKIRTLYNKLAKMKGLDGNGDPVEEAQVTGTIKVETISYADYVALSAMQPEVEIKADIIICAVRFNNYNGSVYNTQQIIQGNTAYNPGIPEKPSTQSNYYTFNRWEYADGSEIKVWNPGVIIEKDIILNPVFDEWIQQYTVTFNTDSDLIHVTPSEIVAYYDTTIEQPTFSELPPGVSFAGWFRPDGTMWSFSTDKVLDNVELKAHWQDPNVPQFTSVSRKNLKTVNYTATDNLGIVAWGFTTTEEQPETWHYIPSTTELNDEYVISEASESYYLWIRDANANTANTRLIGRLINKDIAVGIASVRLYEVVDTEEIDADNFVLNGTRLYVQVELDEHYKDLTINYIVDGNTIELHNGDYIDVLANFTLQVLCTPKDYTVHFVSKRNGMDWGKQLDDIEVTYLTNIPKPLEQYDRGFIISGWYLDEACSDDQVWKFNTDTIKGEMTLYAKWTPYTSPSVITINIPEENNTEEGRTVMVAFSQGGTPGTVTVDFGDNTEIESDSENNLAHIYHTYAATGEYQIKITGPSNGNYSLGDGYEIQIVNPSYYITNVDFSWNLTTLAMYALLGSKIKSAGLTNYMTSINIGTYAGCTELETLVIPPSIVYIGDQAFMDCTAISGTVDIPENVERMGYTVFYNCNKLQGVNIKSKKLTSLGTGLFWNCSSLESIYIPENINLLYGQVFQNCSNLSKVVIANKDLTTSSDGYNIFQGCSQLQTAGPIGSGCDIEFAWDTQIPPRIFFTDPAVINGEFLTEITLPNTIKVIGADAFVKQKIQSIRLPNGLKTIESGAFARSSLTSLDIPFAVSSIGSGILSRCLNLRSVILRNVSVQEAEKITVPELSWFYGVNQNVELFVDRALLQIDEATGSDRTKIVFGPYWNLYQSTDDYYYLEYKGIEE